MNSDALAWLVVLILVVAVVLGVMQYYTAGWVVVAVGIVLIILARVRRKG